MKTIYVNLFGGPCTGKSTMCASIFCKLKEMGIDAEMSLEYAKDAIWEESYKKLENQIYIFGKQHHRMWRLNGKVQVVITDSPFLNSILYDRTKNGLLKQLVIDEFNKINNLNFLIIRDVDYVSNGRMQTLVESIQLDMDIKLLLESNKLPYSHIPKGEVGVNTIIEKIKEELMIDDTIKNP